MTQSVFELRKGIYARLSTDIPATPTYSYTPPETAMPYIVIGEIYANDVGTKTTDMLDYEVTLHLFDKGEGSSATIDALVKSVYDSLHWNGDNITVTGYEVVKCHMTNMNVMQMGSVADYYWHAVMRFNVTVQDV